MENRATNIDLNCVAVCESTHVAFREEAVGEEGEEDELREG
jgi:hypothetical protein